LMPRFCRTYYLAMSAFMCRRNGCKYFGSCCGVGLRTSVDHLG